MFFGHNMFASGAFVSACHMNTKINSLMISNMIVDELKIDDTLNITNVITKEDWDMDTLFDGKFQNNLEAGNLTNSGIPIQYLRFKRRKIGELKWQTMVDIAFDKNMENYDVTDYYIENAVDMEYILVPVTQSLEGSGVSKTITPNYFDLYLTGRDDDGVLQNYPLRFDLELSDITLNEDKTFIKTLSSQYPVLMRGKAKYLTGTIKADLISPTTEEAFGVVNMQSENVYREAFEDFIHSGKPMLIRNHSFYILGTVSEPKKNPFSNTIAFGIWTFDMKFTEIGNAKDMDTLKANNLTYDIITS